MQSTVTIVEWSICLLITSMSCVVSSKWLSQSRCRLQCGLLGPSNHVLGNHQISPPHGMEPPLRSRRRQSIFVQLSHISCSSGALKLSGLLTSYLQCQADNEMDENPLLFWKIPMCSFEHLKPVAKTTLKKCFISSSRMHAL